MINYFKQFYTNIIKKFNQEQINKLENTLTIIKNEIQFLDSNQKIEFFDSSFYIGADNVSIRYNNLSNYNLFNFKNQNDIKIKRIVENSSFFNKNKENIVIEKDKIYTIKKFEKGWVYLKEFGDYNGEFKNEKFELETGFKVCLINDKKLCLIDKNNAIIFSITYLQEQLRCSISKDVDKFYKIAFRISKHVFEKDIKLNNEHDYNSILKNIDISNEIIDVKNQIEGMNIKD